MREGLPHGKADRLACRLARHLPRVAAQLAVGEVPHLDHLVPAAGHDEGDLGGRGEPDTGDPLAVAVLVLNSVLALTQSVPELDSFVSGSAHDLSVV